ncbi:Phosphatidylserine decarboxylase proenzyme 1, mitochondrial [Smittium culicis]|uniref:phosphatidylserine decarboxylase n=1 Tax=Smittium culicis TaxID=133412 RepID=A0A1R1X7F6_9FUNG|nr:Phosphatidylserine decarboxylase proenzyme 1, mitochondrial [Smittium culicis]
MSRMFGEFNRLEIPLILREPLFKLYGYVFNCNYDEMVNPNLKDYKCLSDFFFREIKLEYRPISSSPIVSPSDGKILHFGTVEKSMIEQVKGITYHINDLFGENAIVDPSLVHDEAVQTSKSSNSESLVSASKFAEINGIEYSLDQLIGDGGGSEGSADANSIRSGSQESVVSANAAASGKKGEARVLPKAISKDRDLFYAVVYLAPGDYHRFHSPANFTATNRRHFHGELYSVSPYIAQRLRDLFVLNERVCLIGHWEHGFFGYIPVGATNVGSIVIHGDDELVTNLPEKLVAEKKIEKTAVNKKPIYGSHPTYDGSSNKREVSGLHYDEVLYTNLVGFEKAGQGNGIFYKKGCEIGGFKLGSTVVVVFEAPKTFKFDIQVGQKIKLGESLGNF